MRDHGGAAVQLRDRAQVDREDQFHILALAQAEVRGLDEYTSRAQIDGAAESTTTTRESDVNGGAGAMPGVKSTFQIPNSEYGLLLFYCVA